MISSVENIPPPRTAHHTTTQNDITQTLSYVTLREGGKQEQTCFAMGLSRKHMHNITGLLTHHVTLNRHLTVM